MRPSIARLRQQTIIGIKSEDPLRVWERRTPLTPSDVQSLTQSGVSVHVESSNTRVFRDNEYFKAGAQIVGELDKANLVLGVKEIKKFRSDISYAFFTHTHKGQSYNMPNLQKMIDSNSRFFDWELLTDDTGARLTAFGYLAGYSGMAGGLSSFGLKALGMGHETPFLRLPRVYMFPNAKELNKGLAITGQQVATDGVGGMEPILVTIVGTGRVGQGAKDVLDALGVEWVSPSDIPNVKSKSPGKIYATILSLKDYMVSKDGSPFDRALYAQQPGLFRSDFATKIAPHTTIFLNGSFWEEGCPRLLTTEDLKIIKTENQQALTTIIDVSCDFGGGIEFVDRATTIDDPAIQFDPFTGEYHRHYGCRRSTQISSIEILPTELPQDASIHFSKALLPVISNYINDPLQANDSLPYSRALKRALVVGQGKLTSKHTWLYERVNNSKTLSLSSKKRSALVLGSGLVARPAIVTLLESKPWLNITVATSDLIGGKKLVDSLSPEHAKRVELLDLSITNQQEREKLISKDEVEVVLSLLPAPFHPLVAKTCIKEKKHLITASYVSPEMKALDDEAKNAGIVILNELGLDPGIDHVSAMQLIDQARSKGNKIKSFVSFCGGLPSPEASNGPLGYKFSWSPLGVLTAATNSALFRLNSKTINIPGNKLLTRKFPNVQILRGLNLEGVANRDSISYINSYGLDKDIPTILRGTLRFPSFSESVDAFKRIGLLNNKPLSEPITQWNSLVDVLLNLEHDNLKDKERREALCSLGLKANEINSLMEVFEQLALVPGTSNPTNLPALPSDAKSPIEYLSILLSHLLAYAPHERDMVILHHELGTVSKEGKDELFSSTLVQYGVPGGDSAMATTVGKPIALGALLVLEGKIAARGVLSPTSEQVWRPLIDAFEKNGIRMVEESRFEKGLVDSLAIVD